MRTQTQRILVAGASGYIGRHVVQALKTRGYEPVALVREASDTRTDLSAVQAALEGVATRRWPTQGAALDLNDVNGVVSCIASRTGLGDDARHVDHELNTLLLDAAQSGGVDRFVLLSAICVQKPKLPFQFAKLAFEQELITSGIDYAIIRPTAYFKSLGGQVARVAAGKSFIVFGDGTLTACKPISARDLANYIVDQIQARDSANAVLPIGGPGPALTARQQGELLFALAGKPASFRSVSPAVLRVAHRSLQLLGAVIPALKAKAELARIGHYYATESMLVHDAQHNRYSAEATPEYGRDTLSDFYAQALNHGTRGHDLGAQRLFL